MVDEVLINKAATIERCVARAREDVFGLLAQGDWIDATPADAMKRMVGFRNIAIRGEYQA